MGLIRDLIGLALIFLAWFNPLNLTFYPRIVLFIIGFDVTSLMMKLILFLINFFFPFLGVEGTILVWILLILVVLEFIFFRFKISKFFIILLKFLAVLFSVFFTFQDFQLAFIIAAIDLILNLKH